MSAYSTKAILEDNATPKVVGNSETNTVISKIEQLSCGDSRDLLLIAECSGVTGGAGVIKLQESHRKDGTFTDAGSVTITADGTFEIEINEIDGAGSTLKPYIRAVATTGGGDTITIDRLYKTRRQSP